MITNFKACRLAGFHLFTHVIDGDSNIDIAGWRKNNNG